MDLTEQATELSHSDIRDRICDALDPGCYIVDVYGDDEDGDVVYADQDGLHKAPYEISSSNGKVSASVDHENAVGVHRDTKYPEKADDEDHYAGMEESLRESLRNGLYTSIPLYERFISKAQREKIKNFAGKGNSYPIETPADVAAAAASVGRAGPDNYSQNTIKANIIRIAKKLGAAFMAKLPKAWRGGDSKESNLPEPAELVLQESATTLEPIVLKEARADYEIKLIAPGKGSSAFYPAEVLKRDGPRVFKAGTHVYLNHPTAAEEAARPEGDVGNLAGVLTTDAAYHEAHAKGPGLYGRMKVFADHAQMVEDKAPHVGMSIRASGVAEADRKEGGLPVLKELTHAESVDVVTRAGAGGLILTEAAGTSPASGEVQLTLQEAQSMVNEAVFKATEPFQKRLIEADARDEFAAIMEGSSLHRETRQRIYTESMRALPMTDGALDREKFRANVVQIAQREAEYAARLSGSGTIRGLGPSFAPIGITEADQKAEKQRRKEAKKERKQLEESDRDSFAVIMGGNRDAAKAAVEGRKEFVA